jgi:hypothetical protein
MTKIRKQSQWHVKTQSRLPWRSSPIDVNLEIEFAANIYIVQSVDLLFSSEQSLCNYCNKDAVASIKPKPELFFP